MEWNEVVDVLTAVAAYDRRKIGSADITAWQAAFAARNITNRADAIKAVAEHYAHSTDWLMPAHVIDRVKAMQMARVAGLGQDDVTPDIGSVNSPEEARGYVAVLQARMALVRDGVPVTDAITRVPAPDWLPTPVAVPAIAAGGSR